MYIYRTVARRLLETEFLFVTNSATAAFRTIVLSIYFLHPGITMFALGIGQELDLNELNAIASDQYTDEDGQHGGIRLHGNRLRRFAEYPKSAARRRL